MIESMGKILADAKAGKYAVAAYNTNNLEWTKYILEASQESNSPLIIEVSLGAIKYMGGYNVVSNLIRNMVSDLGITIPVAIHLDHGKDVESCIKAIDAGFTSVMFDGSKLPIDENIKLSKEICEYAHARGVTVEAEVGQVGENGKDGIYADPDECVRLVKEAGVDFLAPALGSVHGLYHGTPHIDFETTKFISELTGVPLVLHGGTGINDDMLKLGILSGICKVNINTELQVAWTKAVREFLLTDSEVYDPRKVISSGEKAIKECIINKNKILGSYGKANN